MTYRDETEASRTEWRDAGEDRVVFQIAPLHTHTINGDRVRLSGIAPEKKYPTFKGVVFTADGEVSEAWGSEGEACSGVEHHRLHEDAEILLRNLGYLGDHLCPG